MIIKQPGAEFFYEDVCYKIGDRIVGTDASEYQGLLGSIIEIRDGEDKETENETPDIYCSFDAPVLPYDIAELEKRFSELYQCKKTIEDIILDEVIMAPEMIETIEQADKQLTKLNIYLVSEDWAVDGESDHSVTPCTDYHTAKRILCEKLAKELDGTTGRRMEIKNCPVCGQPLKKRNGRFGEFWGCTGFPTCRYTENI